MALEKNFINDELRQAMRLHYFTDKCKILTHLVKKFGDNLDKAIDDYVFQSSFDFWQDLAKKENIEKFDKTEEVEKKRISTEENDSGDAISPVLKNYLTILWDQFCTNDKIEFTKYIRDGKVRVRVTRCPWAEMAIEAGQAEWGYRFYCMTDFASIKGFSDGIQLTRTKTLMQGQECCDYCYSYTIRDNSI